ncbi:MAG: tripartite tricarboxylate transporter TctB family protein [Firmicutes bacterium]|nr:tripartite tricarboxylate transporter TctB family protein [Bacillota bacterium]
MKNIDRKAAIMMLAVSIIFWAQMPGLMNPFSIVFPRAILTLLTITSLVLLVRTYLRPKGQAPEVAQSGKAQEPGAGAANAGTWKNVIISVVVVAVWIALLDVVGFYVTSVLAFAFLAWFLGQGVKHLREAVTMLVIIAAEIGVFYVIFAKLLLVPLPTGVLF